MEQDQNWITNEKLRLINANLPMALIMSLGAVCIQAALVSGSVSARALILWLSLSGLIVLVRLKQQRQFARRGAEAGDGAAWRLRLDVGITFSGLCWGLGSALLFPLDLPHQVYVTFVMAGTSAAAMTAYAAFRRSYFLFALPAILPVVFRLALERSEIHDGMAVLSLMYLAVVGRAAITLESMISNSLDVRAQNVELTRALHHEATHDPLVDLINYREFNQRLRAVAAAATANRQPYALLFIDLDFFKAINDTGGHAAGDETLRSIAKILRTQLRNTDTAARVGGDEFVILLPLCPRERAVQIAANILAAIQKFSLPWEGQEFRVGASIGVAYTDAGEFDAAAVLRASDAACYTAKKNGRNRVEVQHADPNFELSGRFALTEFRSRS